jgi:hypothetical protein
MRQKKAEGYVFQTIINTHQYVEKLFEVCSSC